MHASLTENVNAHSLNLTVDTGANIQAWTKNDLGFNLETTGNLTLNAAGGQIVGGKGLVGANLLTLAAAQGIINNQNAPAAAGLNTAAATLDAVNTTSGIIAINQAADAFIGHANGDLVINRVDNQAAGQSILDHDDRPVSIEGTDPVAGQNITGSNLELITQTGIGSSAFLQTDVGTLALVNSTSGNVQINNIDSTGNGAAW